MGKPYLGSIEDIKMLNNLKEKSDRVKLIYNRTKTQYDMMIYTWTDLDVRKRNTAKINNINFKELWNINEAKEFIDNLLKNK